MWSKRWIFFIHVHECKSRLRGTPSCFYIMTHVADYPLSSRLRSMVAFVFDGFAFYRFEQCISLSCFIFFVGITNGFPVLIDASALLSMMLFTVQWLSWNDEREPQIWYPFYLKVIERGYMPHDFDQWNLSPLQKPWTLAHHAAYYGHITTSMTKKSSWNWQAHDWRGQDVLDIALAQKTFSEDQYHHYRAQFPKLSPEVPDEHLAENAANSSSPPIP